MKRTEFITILEKKLNFISLEERKEIIADYNEHFDIGLSEGKTEEEICDSLGDPNKIAKNYKATVLVKKAEKDKSAKSVIKAIIAGLGLGFFNLVIGLPVFIIILTLVITLFSVAASVFLSGIAVTLASIVLPFMSYPGIYMAAAFFAGLGIMAVGTLLIIGFYYFTKFIFTGIINYLKANIKIISEG